MMSDQKISIIDIAQMANVSIATVSRVLNQRGRYSRETEKRILDLVEQVGYTPNTVAQSLRTRKSQSIGVIVPDITNEFFARIVRSIENAVVPCGYSVFVCDTHEQQELETLHINSLIAKNVDGVIYISGKADVAGNEVKNRIPVVYIDRYPENAPTIIQSDNEQGGFLATEELIRKGCRRIVILRDYHHLSTVRHRHQGYVNAHRQYGVEIDEVLLVKDCPWYENAKLAIEQMVREKADFDGIFATNDMMALGALHALLEAGISVPQQVKIVGFDDISLSEFCKIPLTTITQDTQTIGELSVEHLLRQMRGEKRHSQSITVPVALHVREST